MCIHFKSSRIHNGSDTRTSHPQSSRRDGNLPTPPRPFEVYVGLPSHHSLYKYKSCIRRVPNRQKEMDRTKSHQRLTFAEYRTGRKKWTEQNLIDSTTVINNLYTTVKTSVRFRLESTTKPKFTPVKRKFDNKSTKDSDTSKRNRRFSMNRYHVKWKLKNRDHDSKNEYHVGTRPEIRMTILW